MALKKARFAGSWYPGSRSECLRSMKEFDQSIDNDALPDSLLGEKGFAGGIVPHAGWYFSGRTAYSVFKSIDRSCRLSGKRPDLFFVFGMHLPPRAPNPIFIDDGLETPLGPVPVNREASLNSS